MTLRLIFKPSLIFEVVVKGTVNYLTLLQNFNITKVSLCIMHFWRTNHSE